MDRLTVPSALERLALSDQTYMEFLHHGTLSIGIYKPEGIDPQKPHSRDEVYIVAGGNGSFDLDGTVRPVETGEVLFVPAGMPHKFVDFSDDFSVWVLFYGPEGGEVETQQP